MVAAVLLNYQHPRLPIASSPEGNHLRSSPYHVVVRMRFRLTQSFLLRGSSAYHAITGVYCPRSRLQLSNTPAAMATDCENKVEIAAEDKQEEGKNQKNSLPPPPEKPEPGDCCGSGCVRCVWDVYYDELEEYNKLCKSISGESKID